MPNEKFDLGPSLLDEMDFMFRSMSANSEHGESKSPDFDNMNKKNEMAEFASKFHRKNSASLLPNVIGSMKSKKKGAHASAMGGNVKPISTKDEKILNEAIDLCARWLSYLYGAFVIEYFQPHDLHCLLFCVFKIDRWQIWHRIHRTRRARNVNLVSGSPSWPIMQPESIRICRTHRQAISKAKEQTVQPNCAISPMKYGTCPICK